MYNKLNGRNFELENADESLGNDFFIKLKEIEVSAMLDHSIFGFFIVVLKLTKFYRSITIFKIL